MPTLDIASPVAECAGGLDRRRQPQFVLDLTAPVTGVLSDGQESVRWRDVAALVAAIDASLCAQGIPADEPVHLEGVNSVRGALVLLALLARGTTFVLTPATGDAPRFVGRRLRIAGASDGDTPVTLDPGRLVVTSVVADHRPLPADSPLRRGHVLLRTSGSLGSAKLVAHTHAGLLANADNAIGRLALTASDRVLIPVPITHMYGLGAALLPAMRSGASVELLAGANLLRYLDRERSFCPTVAFLTPNLCATLLRPRASAVCYDRVVVAGDRLSAEAFARAHALYRRVVCLYGSTEMGVIAAADAGASEPARTTTAGRPLPGVTLRVRPLPGEPDDAVGELLCAHPHGFYGYVDDDGRPLSADAGAGAGWYATRDVARIHPDGEVELLGRCDHAVKRDGRLVTLAEVERALEALPGVDRAAIVVAGETLRGRGLVAFCSPDAGASLDQVALRQAARAVLPAFATPDRFHVVPALPRLPGGKLDRTSLQRSISSSGQDASP